MKSAVTGVASGREGVASLLHQVERVARYAGGDHKASLGKASGAMRTLVAVFAGFALADTGLGKMGWDRLYKLVREARNDIAHTGTEAVVAETRTKALAAVLLEALLGAGGEEGMTNLAEVMVADPVCAHEWQTVADLRRTMLVTDFSELPVAGCAASGAWPTVTADCLATYLGSEESERQERMGRRLDQAWGEAGRPLLLYDAPTAPPTTPVCDIPRAEGGELKLPLMVTREAAGGRILVGIVTAFDLL